MKQSNKSTNPKKRGITAALYVRLSRDDNLEGESYSIGNQKKLLTKVAKEKGYTNLLTFVDDGISGVTMNRPGFQEMITELEKDYIGAVFVKDMSRLGRNYIEVGRLTEDFFPEHEIRLVAVSDNIDTDEGENELAPIRNLFNEWYSRDISKKRRISNKIKGTMGEPLGQPPYGYIKDPDNPKHWIVDDEAAAVVKRIFKLTLEGKGTSQIADILQDDKILMPNFYWQSKGIKRPGKVTDKDPYQWNSSSIVKILSLQEYCGDVLNFKTYTKSYKNKKRIENDRDEWAIFKDVHTPIVDRSTWEKVQMKRDNIRKRQKSDGEKSMFSGLLVCADCGGGMHYHFNQKNHDIKYFNCKNNNRARKTCTSTHYIRVDFLEQVVLGEIRRLTKFATKYEKEFVKMVVGHSKQTIEFEKQLKQKELNTLRARDKEIDNLFNRMYEDNANGKIDDDRFARMSKQYSDEQKEVSARIKVLQAEFDKSAEKTVQTDVFMKTVRKYTRAKELTDRMLNELIDKIEVHQSERIDGVNVQKLTIHYNCIGSIEIPDFEKIPEVSVTIPTRQGVETSYVSTAIAV